MSSSTNTGRSPSVAPSVPASSSRSGPSILGESSHAPRSTPPRERIRRSRFIRSFSPVARNVSRRRWLSSGRSSQLPSTKAHVHLRISDGGRRRRRVAQALRCMEFRQHGASRCRHRGRSGCDGSPKRGTLASLLIDSPMTRIAPPALDSVHRKTGCPAFHGLRAQAAAAGTELLEWPLMVVPMLPHRAPGPAANRGGFARLERTSGTCTFDTFAVRLKNQVTPLQVVPVAVVTAPTPHPER